MLSSNLALLFLAYILYRLITHLIRARRFRTFAQSRNCAEPKDASGPWPYGLSFILRARRLKQSGEDFLDDILAEDFREANTIQKTAFDYTHMINTREPANLQAMLATQFNDFEIGPRRGKIFGPLLGKSIFTTDGAFWEHSRAMFRPQFSRENINDLDATERACKTLIAAVGEPDADGWTPGLAMQPLLYRFTLDTATDFLFGESVESQRAGINERLGLPPSKGTQSGSATFVEDMEYVSEFTISRIRLQSLYWLCDGFRFRKAAANIRRFADTFVRKALDYAADGKADDKQKLGLLSSLVTQTRDREELASQTLGKTCPDSVN